MAIIHRIFTKGYKRPGIKKTAKLVKPTYKKFLGLPTLSLYKQEAAAITGIAVKKAKSRKTRKPLKIFTIRPALWSLLGVRSSRKEFLQSRQDIITFLEYYTPAGTTKILPDANFQAYVKPAVWATMSGEEKKRHIQKRQELTARGVLRKTSSHRHKYSGLVNFSDRDARPLLNLITKTQRKLYLRFLVKQAIQLGQQGIDRETLAKAKFETVRPTKVQQTNVASYNLKKILATGKKSKQIVKNKLSKFTYVSIVG